MSKSEKRKKLIREHKRLVNVLRSPSHKDDKKELKIQERELEEYESTNKSKVTPKEFAILHKMLKNG